MRRCSRRGSRMEALMISDAEFCQLLGALLMVVGGIGFFATLINAIDPDGNTFL